jgi:TolA-binding protein
VKSRFIPALAAVAAAVLIPASSALAQRQPPTPEQRIERLERQLQQVQRQVFPRGRPAETAGFSDEPAATQSSVATLDQRLDALEGQLTTILRQSEENGHRVQTLEAELTRLRTEQEQRITALEQRAAAAIPAAIPAEPLAATPAPAATPSKPRPQTASTTTPSTTAASPTSDPGEDAYSEGFHLFDDGRYDEAIAALRNFVAAYPKHRRVSYARNLIGRSLLEKGDARAAAEALLANYRSNPKGDRAADSLYYLGQSLMKLDQPSQACRAYGELEDVYGKTMRAELRTLLPPAKAQARCS